MIIQLSDFTVCTPEVFQYVMGTSFSAVYVQENVQRKGVQSK